MKRFLCIILTIAALMGICVPVMAAEGSLDGWWLERSGNNDGSVVVDTSVVHSGKASAKFTRSTPAKSNVYIMFCQSVPCEEGKTYKYGFWAKAQNINNVSTLIDWNARVYINPIRSTYDWTYFTFTYVHTGGSRNVTFKIIIDGPTSALWIDDAEFCEYNDGKKGENMLKNPGFEGNNATVVTNSSAAADSDTFTAEDFAATIANSTQLPVYKTDKITIDGDISDWEGTTTVNLPSDDFHLQKYVSSEVDAEVSMSFAYDDDYFYFLTVAKDNKFYEKDGSDYWQGDSIQLALSDEEKSYGAEIGYNYNENGGGKYSLDFGTNEMSGLLLNTKRVGNVTYYESAIPWNLYYGKFMDKIKFSAIYNDNDGDGRRYALQLSPGIAEGKVNTKFPTLHMVPEGAGFFVWVEGEASCTVFEENEYTVCILNNAAEKKTYKVTVDGVTKELDVPALTGKKLVTTAAFDEVGHMVKEFTIDDGNTEYVYKYRSQVIATPDYYDSALEELRGKLDEINGLIAECKEKGISTDYEDPVAFIIERFITHIKTNAENEEYDTMDYTFEELERMYQRAKTSLNAYLAGEKEAFSTPKYTTGDVDIIGQTHWANTKNETTGAEEYRPVFFVGYGHFEEVIEDIPIFKQLGNNTIQNEIGPNSFVRSQKGSVPYFGIDIGNGYNVDYTMVKDKNVARSGSAYLKIESKQELQANRYNRLLQTVEVEPNTTYELGGTIKGTDVQGSWFHGILWPDDSGRFRINGTYDWKEVVYEITTGENQTSTTFGITTEAPGELLVDDLFFRKKGTKTNLLRNGSFEEAKFEDVGDKYRILRYNLEPLKEKLKSAEENDISFSLLLSPHYLPSELIEDEIGKKAGWFSLKNKEAMEIIELYLKTVLTEAIKYDSLTNICITNEPTYNTTKYGDLYKADFADYLREVYDGNINELNRIYGSDYASFESVPWPDGTTPSVLFYDWKQFNDKTVYDWNKWYTDTIRKYAPGIPLHSKIMSTNFEDDSALRIHMTYGSNYENYAKFSDVNGCDAFNYYSPVKQPQKLGNNTNPTSTDALEKTQWYDMLTSNKFRPVYNTEDHVIVDSSGNYVHENAIHVGADNWQGGIHGRGYTDYWVWVSHHLDSATRNSFQTRPDAIYEVSKSTLDLNRLSYEVSAVADKQPEVAIMLSDTSRVYQYAYENNVYKAYEASLYTGVKTSYITDNTVERAHNHEVVICPDTVNVKKEVAEELLNYAKSGKTLVLLGGDCLTRDEHNQPLDEELVAQIKANSMIIETVNDGFKMTEPKDLKKQLMNLYNEKGMRPVRVVYADTGYDVDMVEYMYTNYNGKLLLNLCLYDWTDDQNIKVLINDKPVTSALEMRSMEEVGEVIELKTHEPILLQIDTDVSVDDSGIKLQIGNPVMTVDDKRVPIDAQSDETVPVIENSRTLLPIRAIMDAVGGESEWDEETRTVICKYNGREVRMTIDSLTAYVNGEEKALDAAPKIINSRTMLPLRFVAEAFELNVDWDGSGKIVTVNKQ